MTSHLLSIPFMRVTSSGKDTADDGIPRSPSATSGIGIFLTPLAGRLPLTTMDTFGISAPRTGVVLLVFFFFFFFVYSYSHSAFLDYGGTPYPSSRPQSAQGGSSQALLLPSAQACPKKI